MAHRELHILSQGDKTYGGYLSIPPAGKGPGLLLIQEVYGVNADVKAIANYFATAGYVVLAPDLFWRRQPFLTFAYADRANAGKTLVDLGGLDALTADLAPALDALRQAPEFDGTRAGLVGLGLGGVVGYAAVTQGAIKVDAAVSYFAGRLDLTAAHKLTQPWLFHFGEHDAVVNPRNLAQLTADAFSKRDDVDVVIHNGVVHGFAIPGRPEFDAVAARAANVKSLDFLSRTIGWRTQL